MTCPWVQRNVFHGYYNAVMAELAHRGVSAENQKVAGHDVDYRIDNLNINDWPEPSEYAEELIKHDFYRSTAV